MRITDDDIRAIEAAIRLGQVVDPDYIIDLPTIPDATMPLIQFPAELIGFGSVRTGDIKVEFLIPNQWKLQLVDIDTAMRRRLVVTLQEWDGIEHAEIIDDLDEA